jgi:hypothetical protein
MLSRRKFAFWVGFGLFSLANRLRVYGLDELAAGMMRAAEPDGLLPPADGAPIHWRAADNGTWRWFERETFVGGKWTLSGITTPIHVRTGEAYAGLDGYLDETAVPEHMREAAAELRQEIVAEPELDAELAAAAGEPDVDAGDHVEGEHHARDERRARHGRPPSQWLRSLYADELRVWLKTVEPPEAGVSGMSFWEHLTRDHLFDPARIAGLTDDEQAKLHGAAHHGY